MNALLVFKSKSAEILKIDQTAKDSGAICQSVCEGHQLMTKVTISQERVVIGAFKVTVKPVIRGHSKIDKTKILMTNGSLMKV